MKSRKRFIQSPWQPMLAILLSWTVIGAGMGLALVVDGAAMLVSILLVGVGQHALAILAHDGAHRLLFASRALNDWVSRALLAWPLLADFDKYRSEHLDHHRCLNTGKDPDWSRNRPDLLAEATTSGARLYHLAGFGHAGQTFASYLGSRGTSPTARGLRLARLIFYVVVGLLLCLPGASTEVLLLWFSGYVFVFLPLMRFRGIIEHWCPQGQNGACTRTVVLPFPLSFMLFPFNIGFHTAHHQNPSIPFYRLKTYHATQLGAMAPDQHRIEGIAALLSTVKSLLTPARQTEK